MKAVEEILKTLTLEEKASLCSGGSVWFTKEIKGKDIPEVMMTDGPHGLRKQLGTSDILGINASVEATCFPSAAAVCNSWDEELIYEIGQALGKECQAEEVSVLLGPGANIKRSPLCGRNFEYFSEDPFLSSNMAKSHINGVQSQGVGTSLKHFAVNNQETRRLTVDAVVEERALREIYLASFETAIKEAKPWTIMTAYNQVNGEHCSENHHLLKEILRDEWGYEGVVISDWGAANNQIEGMKETFDIRMPYGGEKFNEQIVQAVKNGELDEKILDDTVRRILKLVKKGIESHKEGSTYDQKAHHALALRAAAESAVLLKNDEEVLPLSEKEKIAVIGGFAKNIRFQGGGSSHINPTCLKNLLTAYEELKPDVQLTFARGFRLKKDIIDEDFVTEALECVKDADKVVLCLGLPYGWESEGYDREKMSLPDNQIDMIHRLAKSGKPVIALLFTGAPVEMPWIDEVDAIFAMYTAGQAVSEAIIKIIYGEINPCGKLAETYPVQMEDTPCSLNYPQKEKAVYEEGIFVGYRYYEKKKRDVLFTFGHGLSYTSWKYSNLKLDKESMEDTEDLTVMVDITNTGERCGKEIVQLYVSDNESEVSKPIKELKGFKKVSCLPGETKTVTFKLNKRSFAYYNTKINDWYVEDGIYEILIGASSADIRLSKQVAVKSTTPIKKVFTEKSVMCEIVEHPAAAKLLEQVMGGLAASDMTPEEAKAALNDEENNVDIGIDLQATSMDMPIGKMVEMSGGMFTDELLQEILKIVNS